MHDTKFFFHAEDYITETFLIRKTFCFLNFIDFSANIFLKESSFN